MATSASANSAQTVTTVETIFDAAANGGACSAIKIRCTSASAAGLLVNVEDLHVAGEFALVPINSEETFAGGRGDIAKVTAKAVSGTATLDWHLVSRR